MPRIIYSLLFELEPDDSPPASMYLVANLDRTGNSEFCRPCAPKTRTIDLRVGDLLHHVRSKSTLYPGRERLSRFHLGHATTG